MLVFIMKLVDFEITMLTGLLIMASYLQHKYLELETHPGVPESDREGGTEPDKQHLERNERFGK